jgi:hypothetical protein
MYIIKCFAGEEKKNCINVISFPFFFEIIIFSPANKVLSLRNCVEHLSTTTSWKKFTLCVIKTRRKGGERSEKKYI